MKNYIINSEQVSSEVFENEAVIVNFMTGRYFGLSGSGPEIWSMFNTSCNVEKLLDSLKLTHPDIRDDQIMLVNNFILDLVREQLLVPVDANEDISREFPEDIFAQFSIPILEIYDDLQELIVLDPIHDTDPERGWPAQQRMIKP